MGEFAVGKPTLSRFFFFKPPVWNVLQFFFQRWPTGPSVRTFANRLLLRRSVVTHKTSPHKLSHIISVRQTTRQRGNDYSNSFLLFFRQTCRWYSGHWDCLIIIRFWAQIPSNHWTYFAKEKRKIVKRMNLGNSILNTV